MGRLAGLCLCAWGASIVLATSALNACSPAQAVPAKVRPARTQVTPNAKSTGDESFDFPEVTSSPRPLGALPPQLAPFSNRCARGDAALARVAERFARRQSQGEALRDGGEISFALRAEGSPYVWPRLWTLQGTELLSRGSVERLDAWLAGFGNGGERRCGVAFVERGEQSVLSVVATDARADLRPLLVRQRTGAWIDVEAELLVEASEAKVVVLGPNGAPHPVPTSFDGRHARARFRADRPGPFLIQLLASMAGGPMPVLEATVYADVDPPSSFFGQPAPGEPEAPLPADAEATGALLEMVNRARASEQLAPLARDAQLDAIAQHHAQAMRRLKRIVHDAGEGDPRTRVEAAQLDVFSTGENVAYALDVRLAHRMLWASPSHRENLLEARFDRVGIGAAPDDDGSVYVCELFADFVK